jgi:hypothetical protein
MEAKVSEVPAKKELTEEEVIGEQLSKEYIEKVDFKKSAEVKMFLYVVCATAVMIALAAILSRFATK